MKFRILTILGLSLFLISSGPKQAGIKSKLRGEWLYQSSLADSISVRLKENTHCPVRRMIFSVCGDKTELKKMPPSVRQLRKNNVLENLSCVTFNDKKIDTYYPVATQIEIDQQLVYFISNYGSKYKSEYYIDELNNDTLVIHDNKRWTIDNKNYSSVKHIYTKKIK